MNMYLRFLGIGNEVAALAVTADRGKAYRFSVLIACTYKPVQDRGLTGIFAYSDRGYRCIGLYQFVQQATILRLPLYHTWQDCTITF